MDAVALTPYSDKKLLELLSIARENAAIMEQCHRTITAATAEVEAVLSDDTKAKRDALEALKEQAKLLEKEVKAEIEEQTPADLKNQLLFAGNMLEHAKTTLGYAIAELNERNPDLPASNLSLGYVNVEGVCYEMLVNGTRKGGYAFVDPVAFIESIGGNISEFKIDISIPRAGNHEHKVRQLLDLGVHNGTIAGVQLKPAIITKVKGDNEQGEYLTITPVPDLIVGQHVVNWNEPYTPTEPDDDTTTE